VGRAAEFVLASASPRRLELLQRLGLAVIAVPSDVNEHDPPSALTPMQHVLRLAEAKARAVAGRLRGRERPAVVLGADTAVVLHGRLLGKPRDPVHAAELLRRLSGRSHTVLTAVFVVRTDDGRQARAVEATRVRFRDYDEATVRWYVRSGEPMDKAGAYGIQGRGALLARRIEGSWSNVVGLPLERLPELFRAVGLDLLELTGD
jgi:septum formation protein